MLADSITCGRKFVKFNFEHGNGGMTFKPKPEENLKFSN